MPGIDGLVTGLDTTSIIEGLLRIQQSRIAQLTNRQRGIRGEQTSFAGVEARLLTLRGALSRLASSTSNVLDNKVVTSSDESLLVASAGARAETGVYTLKVNSVAQRHQVASNGFTSLTDTITQGKLFIQVGSGATKSITIDAANNTVQGLVDAINGADVGASATIIQDSSGGTPVFKVLLSSSRTGADHAIAVTNNLDPTGGGATQPTFDLNNPVQAATNASVTLGTGAGAITLQNDTNQIDNLLPGVNLDIVAADPTKPVTLNIKGDTTAATEAVSEFVSAYNDVVAYIKEQSQYNAEAEIAGPLLGNRSVNGIFDQLSTTLTTAIGGLSTSANRLSVLGITLDEQGALKFNASKLESILTGSNPDVSREDVRRLFALSATSSNSAIKFVVGSSKTQTGTIEVDITAAAEQARVTGTQRVAASTVIDGNNNLLTLSLDGSNNTTVTLRSGTYTPTELAAEVQRSINASEELAGRSVSATIVDGSLQITSTSYGSSSELKIVSGSSLSQLGLDAGAADVGQNVVGRFIVDGVVEEATGRGNLLEAKAGNEFTDGLQVRVTLNSSQVVAGNEATLKISRGYASLLDQQLGEILDPVDGQIKTANKTYDERVNVLQTSIDRLNTQFDARREALLRRFTQLETAVSELQTLQGFVSSQLGASSFLR